MCVTFNTGPGFVFRLDIHTTQAASTEDENRMPESCNIGDREPSPCHPPVTSFTKKGGLVAVSIYNNNKLWESHRVILPEFREKVICKCRDCRYHILIQGKEEVRWGCIERYKELWSRHPERIPVLVLLKLVGEEGLYKILGKGDPAARACGHFMRKLPPKNI